ncbi:DUF3267 domain-containing protein [Haloarchaeobius sp. DFWS5]|uniref:DUF3267 domain-containing protein n=1 Tax=Haloarchaeobius sp. DFWS5 TaxID=3446114 RepID=UPI003EB825D4
MSEPDEPTASHVPDTPAGYQPPQKFEYPLWVVVGTVVVLLWLSALVYGTVLWVVQGPSILDGVVDTGGSDDAVVFTVDMAQVVVPLVVGIGATTVLHELCHGLVYRRLGYEVSYGVALHMGAVYAAAFHQYQTREDALKVLVAPLVCLTALSIPLLFVQIPLVALTGFAVLVVNTAGAAGDVFAMWAVNRLPAKSLLYDCDASHMYVFEPEVGASVSSERGRSR